MHPVRSKTDLTAPHTPTRCIRYAFLSSDPQRKFRNELSANQGAVSPVPDGSSTHSSGVRATSLKIGSYVVDGKYKILRLIGRGAVGEVYQVEQVFLGQQFALKILSNVDVSDATLRRFQLEAKAVNMLEHRNLVRGIDFGLIDGSQPFLVMDYVEGQNLSALLKSEGSLPISSVIEIFVSLCEAMDYAHANGVIHRDLKPSNIVLVQSSAGKMIPKIVDFGIAKVEMANARTLTRTGEVFGTPIYMSPEQCSGAKVDRRSDIYSLGCILFEALTGAPPFCGDTAVSTMMMHGNKAPSTLKEASPGLNIPEGLEEVVAKMLEKAPSNRYANCGDIANDLRLIGSGQFGKAEKEAVANDLATRQSKRILFFVAVLAPVALVAVAIVCVIWLGQMAPPKASDTKHSEIATVTSTSTLTDELDKNEAGQRKTSQSPSQAPSPLKKDSHSWPPVAEKTVNEEEDQIFKRDVEKLKELHEIGRDPGSIFQVGDDCLSVSDGALADLKKLPWLTELHLSECENITESGIVDVLKGLKQVRFLALDHTKVDGERLLPYLQSEYSRRGHPLYFLHLSHDRITRACEKLCR